MQDMRDRPTHHPNVVSEQRKADRQHPNAEYREETQHSATGERDTGRHAYPYCARSTKALEITASPVGDVVLQAVHFLVEIGHLDHCSSTGRQKIEGPYTNVFIKVDFASTNARSPRTRQ